jgi:D-alanine-D-alanine ligase
MQSRKIGVLLGGLSSEREVSLRTGEAVLAALRDRGHDAVPVYVDRDIDVALRQERIEVAFVALHGRWGEDGSVQGMLEMLGIPYTGSDVLASALAMHKGKAKELFRLHNLPTPAYYTMTNVPVEQLAEVHGDFGFPCVVKPVREGSSVGVAICHSLAELAPAVERALCFDNEILVERFITGREVSVAVLDDRALGAVEIAPRAGFYDYANKYTRGATDYFCHPSAIAACSPRRCARTSPSAVAARPAST